MKSVELNRMLLALSLFWAPVANCVFLRPVHMLPAQRIVPTMEMERMSIPLLPSSEHSQSPRPARPKAAPLCSPCLGAHTLPVPRALAGTEEGCLPRARKLFTKEITLIKGIKIAGNDGKHSVERSVDTRGNGAVNKIGGDRHKGRSSQATTLQG